MRYIVALMILSSCVAIPPSHPGTNNCGMSIGRDFDSFNESWLEDWQLQDRLDAALDVAARSTDFRLSDMMENCRALVGYKVYTKEGTRWENVAGKMVMGECHCAGKFIIISRSISGDYRDTSLVHEIIHAMQKCAPLEPLDEGQDKFHSNWIRDGIYENIEKVRRD